MSYYDEDRCGCSYKPFIKKYIVCVKELRKVCERKPVCRPVCEPVCRPVCRPVCEPVCRPTCRPKQEKCNPCHREREHFCDGGYEEEYGRGHGGEEQYSNSAPEFGIWHPTVRESENETENDF